MARQGRITPPKRGLNGWRAFWVVVASGTLAAVVVVAILFGLLRAVGSAFSGASDSSPQVAQTWRPAASMAPGALNLCESMETSSQTGAFRSMFPSRVDPGGDYVDPGPDESERVVSDECTWNLQSSGLGEWEFSLSYEAVASSVTAPAEEVAREKFESLRAGLASDFSGGVSEEEMSDMMEDAYAVYGKSRENGRSLYAFLGRTRGGVVEIRIQGKDGDVSESEFRQLVRKTVPVLHSRLERVLPE